MLPSSISSHCEGLSSESLIKAKEWMVDLVDSSLEAGKRDQGYPLQYVCTPMVQEGVPVDPVSQNNLGTFRSPARNPGMPSDTDFDMLVLKTKEWTVYLIDQRLEAWPDLSQGYEAFRRANKDGLPVARVLQTIPYTLVGPAKFFTISSVTNAGKLVGCLCIFQTRRKPHTQIAPAIYASLIMIFDIPCFSLMNLVYNWPFFLPTLCLMPFFNSYGEAY